MLCPHRNNVTQSPLYSNRIDKMLQRKSILGTQSGINLTIDIFLNLFNSTEKHGV